jgi:hypothetical protein
MKPQPAKLLAAKNAMHLHYVHKTPGNDPGL